MEKIKQISSDLKCLANEHRLTIVSYLKKKKSASVGEIADNTRISFKATSKHLLSLLKKGILVSHYDGPFVMYSLSTNQSELIKNIISLIYFELRNSHF
ncbi:MAG: hypothetical protein C0412_18555 [Flavobacterium sp.]|nr:hypothetical protein [Flavobacterium sp.]